MSRRTLALSAACILSAVTGVACNNADESTAIHVPTPETRSHAETVPKGEPESVERIDAEEVLKDALARAAVDKKLVFLHLGAPWCGWCVKLEEFLHEKRDAFNDDYIVVKIDIDEMTNGKSVAQRLRGTDRGGIPWMAILDAHGKCLITSDGPNGTIGHPVAPEEIKHFIAMLKATSERMTAKQLADIEESLSKPPDQEPPKPIASRLGDTDLRPVESPQAMLEKVMSDWKERQKWTDTVRYRISGANTYIKHMHILPDDPDLAPGVDIGEGLPVEDHTSPFQRNWLIDFENNRLRLEQRFESFSLSSLKYSPRYEVQAFDGGLQFQTFRPNGQNTSDNYKPSQTRTELFLDDEQIMLYTVHYPILFAHGLFPLSDASIDYHDLNASGVDGLSGVQIQGQAMVNGIPCTSLKIPNDVSDIRAGYKEFLVDPSRNNAVLRWRSVAVQDGHERVFMRIEIEYQENANGWFLPNNWMTQFFWIAGLKESQVWGFEKVVVEDAEVNLAVQPSDFEIPLSAGMYVYDWAKRKNFRVAADGKTLRPFSREDSNGSLVE